MNDRGLAVDATLRRAQDVRARRFERKRARKTDDTKVAIEQVNRVLRRLDACEDPIEVDASELNGEAIAILDEAKYVIRTVGKGRLTIE